MWVDNTLTILGINIGLWNYDKLLKSIEISVQNKSRLMLSYVNAYVALHLRRNSDLLLKLNQSVNLYSDGVGMYLAQRLLYPARAKLTRIVATDFNSLVLNLAERKNYNVYFFGGGDDATAVLGSRLKKLYPGLNVKGISGRESVNDESILEKLNSSNSDILFIGLGTPLQEEWIANQGKKCNIPIQIAVGSGIDYLAGTYKRAPLLFQKIGLEWFSRLIIDPKRLWKRYLIGIPQFIFLVHQQFFTSRIKK